MTYIELDGVGESQQIEGVLEDNDEKNRFSSESRVVLCRSYFTFC